MIVDGNGHEVAAEEAPQAPHYLTALLSVPGPSGTIARLSGPTSDCALAWGLLKRIEQILEGDADADRTSAAVYRIQDGGLPLSPGQELLLGLRLVRGEADAMDELCLEGSFAEDPIMAFGGLELMRRLLIAELAQQQQGTIAVPKIQIPGFRPGKSPFGRH